MTWYLTMANFLKHVLPFIQPYYQRWLEVDEDAIIKSTLKSCMRKEVAPKDVSAEFTPRVPSKTLKPIIVNEKLEPILDKIFKNLPARSKGEGKRQGGVYIAVGPRAAGKSTYLQARYNEYLQESGENHGMFFDEIQSTADFKERFGVKDMLYLEKLPEKSVIVWDQFESSEEFDPKNLTLIKMISHKAKKMGFDVIVCTSDLEVAEKLLLLSGLTKIKLLCTPATFKWTESEVRRFVDTHAKFLSDEDKDWFYRQGIKVKIPGHMYEMLGVLKEGPLDEARRRKLEEGADTQERVLNEFMDKASKIKVIKEAIELLMW